MSSTVLTRLSVKSGDDGTTGNGSRTGGVPSTDSTLKLSATQSHIRGTVHNPRLSHNTVYTRCPVVSFQKQRTRLEVGSPAISVYARACVQPRTRSLRGFARGWNFSKLRPNGRNRRVGLGFRTARRPLAL